MSSLLIAVITIESTVEQYVSSGTLTVIRGEGARLFGPGDKFIKNLKFDESCNWIRHLYLSKKYLSSIMFFN